MNWGTILAAEASKAPLAVYLLADHLDSMLAAGEDLVARGHDWRVAIERSSNDTYFPSTQREIAEDVRGFELTLIARALKAREHARLLAGQDKRFAPIATLFASGTAQLADAVEECGDARHDDFETGDGIVAYVRTRGLIAPDAAYISRAEYVTIDDAFLVAKRVPLGQLLDMAAAFLDALDVQYDLYQDRDDGGEALPAAPIKSSRRERMPVN